MAWLKFGIMYPDHLLNWLGFDHFPPLSVIFIWNEAIMVILTLVLRMHESDECPDSMYQYRNPIVEIRRS